MVQSHRKKIWMSFRKRCNNRRVFNNGIMKFSILQGSGTLSHFTRWTRRPRPSRLSDETRFFIIKILDDIGGSAMDRKFTSQIQHMTEPHRRYFPFFRSYPKYSRRIIKFLTDEVSHRCAPTRCVEGETR